MRSHCGYELEILTAFADGTLPNSAAERLRSHLAQGCQTCTTTVASLRQLIAGVRGAGRIVQPAYSLDRAKSLFRERMPTRPLVARLVLDTRLSPAYGLRGGPPEAFKLVYSTAAHDIDLWNEPQQDGSWYLIGQALPRDGSPPEPPRSAALIADSAGEIDLRLDGAEFHGSGLVSGTYGLRLALPAGEIVAPEIRIGA